MERELASEIADLFLRDVAPVKDLDRFFGADAFLRIPAPIGYCLGALRVTRDDGDDDVVPAVCVLTDGAIYVATMTVSDGGPPAGHASVVTQTVPLDEARCTTVCFVGDSDDEGKLGATYSALVPLPDSAAVLHISWFRPFIRTTMSSDDRESRRAREVYDALLERVHR